ncbi:hypothetical protein [Streptomyces sp. ISL-100]|uniref:hypothetical protein n=1 Tax=Streptomyces sp. ISL-100 TaxID=2819173 RepID=UPI001BEA2121|nr:hypothetical protein [Streptomyces sp. ISL-100]MBT2401422.1 hypothetical protein [Streptomyces sp. ISL-100]
MIRSTRISLTALAAAALLAGSVGVSGAVDAPAGSPRASSAGVLDLHCNGTMRFEYSPHLLFTPQNATLHGTGGLTCASSTNPNITNAQVDIQGSGSLSCTGGQAEGTARFDYNDGSSSTVKGEFLLSARPGGEIVTAIRGTVTGGQFQGDTVVGEYVGTTTTPFDCANPQEGLDSTSGPVNIDFTGLAGN